VYLVWMGMGLSADSAAVIYVGAGKSVPNLVAAGLLNGVGRKWGSNDWK
jgi:hypothetical protein